MRQTKFGEQPAKHVLRARGYSIGKAALALGVTQGHLHGCLDGEIRPNVSVRDKLPKLLDMPLEQLFTQTTLEWQDQRLQRPIPPVVCISDTDWWSSSYTQVARDVIIQVATNEANVRGCNLTSTEPKREIISVSPAMWRYTWQVIKS